MTPTVRNTPETLPTRLMCASPQHLRSEAGTKRIWAIKWNRCEDGCWKRKRGQRFSQWTQEPHLKIMSHYIKWKTGKNGDALSHRCVLSTDESWQDTWALTGPLPHRSARTHSHIPFQPGGNVFSPVLTCAEASGPIPDDPTPLFHKPVTPQHCAHTLEGGQWPAVNGGRAKWIERFHQLVNWTGWMIVLRRLWVLHTCQIQIDLPWFNNVSVK